MKVTSSTQQGLGKKPNNPDIKETLEAFQEGSSEMLVSTQDGFNPFISAKDIRVALAEEFGSTAVFSDDFVQKILAKVQSEEL